MNGQTTKPEISEFLGGDKAVIDLNAASAAESVRSIVDLMRCKNRMVFIGYRKFPARDAEYVSTSVRNRR